MKKPLLKKPTNEEIEHYAQMEHRVIEGWPPFLTPFSREFRTKYEALEKAKLVRGIVWVKGNFVFSIQSMTHIW
jgi:hypothetical protein